MMSGAERPALIGSSNDSADGQNHLAADQDPVLATLKERRRKRAIEAEAQRDAAQQRPLATQSRAETEQTMCRDYVWQC